MKRALGAAGELAIRSLIDRAPLASSLADAYKVSGFRLALVGGSVRDAILGRLGNDLDFTTDATPEVSKKILSKWAENVWDTGIAFGTVVGKRGDTTVEVTTYRSDSYDIDSRKPEVEYGESLEGDLSRRDFTVNAMALELTQGAPIFVDPHNGLKDLSNRVLRTPSKAEQSFSDDPLRMMRAARFASQLEFSVDDDALRAMRDMAGRISIISAERIRDEFVKLLMSDNPRTGTPRRTGERRHREQPGRFGPQALRREHRGLGLESPGEAHGEAPDSTRRRAWHRRSGGSCATAADRLRVSARSASIVTWRPTDRPARRPSMPKFCLHGRYHLLSLLRPQQRPQLLRDRLARPEDARAHRADRAIHDLRDILVAHALDLAQRDRRAQLLGQRIDACVHRLRDLAWSSADSRAC